MIIPNTFTANIARLYNVQLNEFRLGHDRFAGKGCKSVNGKIGVRAKRDFRRSVPCFRNVTLSRHDAVAPFRTISIYFLSFFSIFIRYMNFCLIFFLKLLEIINIIKRRHSFSYIFSSIKFRSYISFYDI